MKNMKIPAVAVFCMVSIIDGSSQEIQLPKNSLYFELFGAGGLYSINYERQVTSKLYGRFGLTTLSMVPSFGSPQNDALREKVESKRIVSFFFQLTPCLENSAFYSSYING